MKKIIVLFFFPLLFYGCGYNLTGYGTAWPQKFKKMMISGFFNQTARADLDLYFNDAFKKEFVKRGRLTVVSDLKDADLVLEGTIHSLEIVPISYDNKAEASSYLTKLRISLTLFAPENGMIYYKGENIFREEQLNIGEQDFQTQEDHALQLVAEKFASSIASLIFENF